MPIENRDLPVGTRLAAVYKKVRYLCAVEADEEGKLAFVLEDGKRYKSPSSAASAVMNGAAANGWRFWTVESEQAAAVADAAQRAPKGRKAAGTRTRSKKVAPEAPQAEAGDYMIDGDGRPINDSETSGAEEEAAPADASATPRS